MIEHLSTIITTIKEVAFRHILLRYLCYLGILLALLGYWISFGGEEISFVYNAF